MTSNQNIKKNTLKNFIDLGFSKLELKTGYIRQTFTDDTTIDMEKALLVKNSIKKLTHSKKLPVLLISSHGIQPTLEVRKYGATENANKYISALAITMSKGNLAHLLLGNFIVKIDKRPMPTRIFINESEAKKWLIKHIN